MAAIAAKIVAEITGIAAENRANGKALCHCEQSVAMTALAFSYSFLTFHYVLPYHRPDSLEKAPSATDNADSTSSAKTLKCPIFRPGRASALP